MKKLAIAALIFTLASFANASKDDEVFCEGVADQARLIMTQRQDGVPITILYQVINDLKAPSASKVLYKEIVKDAYEKPHFKPKESQLRMIEWFSNNYFLDCLKQFER